MPLYNIPRAGTQTAQGPNLLSGLLQQIEATKMKRAQDEQIKRVLQGGSLYGQQQPTAPRRGLAGMLGGMAEQFNPMARYRGTTGLEKMYAQEYPKTMGTLPGLEKMAEPPTPSAQITQLQLDYLNSLPKDKRAEVIKAMVTKPTTSIMIGKPASAAERTALAETNASIDALNNLKMLFDSAQTVTGPIAGRVEPTKGLFGLTTDEQESFMAATSAFKNAIIKEITGAQMSEVEAKRIMKQVPDITDPPARWSAKWEQSKKNLEFLQKRRLEILRQSGIRVPGETPQGQPETITPQPTKADKYGAAIQQAKSQLPPDATTQQILDLAEQIILGIKAPPKTISPVSPTREETAPLGRFR